MKKLLQHSLVRYIVVGGSSVVIDYVVFVALYNLFDIALSVSLTTGFIVGLLWNFLLNKFWAFQSDDNAPHRHKRETMLYAALVVFNFGFTNGFVVVVDAIGIPPEVSKIIATAMITLWNYYLYKHYIFKRAQTISDDDSSIT